MRIAFLAGVLVTGCQFNAATLDEGMTPTPDAMPPMPDAPGTTCTAPFCEDGALMTCDGQSTACTNGCVSASSTGEAHCGVFVPSYGVSLSFATATGTEDKTLSGGRYVVNTNSGSIFRCGATGDPADLVSIRETGSGVKQGIFYQRLSVANAPDVSAFGFLSLTIAADAEIYAIGDASLSMISSGPLQISGAIRLVGGETACSLTTACALVHSNSTTQAECAAPGGGAGGGRGANGHGAGAGQAGNADGEGGGGGAHASIGGDGGKTGGAGGEAFAIGPLQGGGGGAGGRDDGGDDGGHGGGGGGALQLVSAASITLTAPEINGGLGITVGGGGGTPGQSTAGGAGGGAGGMILLEAPAISVTNAFLLANGGGGGSGNCAGGAGDLLCWGVTSGFSLTTAPGGETGAAGTAIPGGDGGAGETQAGGPGQGDAGAAGGGGGGGSVGRILLRTATSMTTIVGDKISPEPQQLPIVVQ